MSVILVAGVQGSGMSLVMQMLDAGGVPCVGSLPAPDGHAAKMAFPCNPPTSGNFRVIRVTRNPRQVCLSRIKMRSAFNLERSHVSEEDLANDQPYVLAEASAIERWVHSSRFPQLTLSFEATLLSPMAAAFKIATFCGIAGRISAMARCVVPRTPDVK